MQDSLCTTLRSENNLPTFPLHTLAFLRMKCESERCNSSLVNCFSLSLPTYLSPTLSLITLACLRNLRKPSSSGNRKRRAWPHPPALAVRPTRWMYSFGSSGGSYWTIQSTSGMSSPLAATSVQHRIPCSAWQNSRNVDVLFCCFWRP